MSAMRDGVRDWASIDVRCKPSKAISRDSNRPDICLGHVRHEGVGSFLYCTNSFLLARIPIAMDCEKGERGAVLPEVGIGSEALDGAARFRVRDGLLEIEGRTARYPVVHGASAPNFADLMRRPQREQSTPPECIAFNPEFLQAVAEAIGAMWGGSRSALRIEACAPNQAMTVRSDVAPGIGLLMPVRTS